MNKEIVYGNEEQGKIKKTIMKSSLKAAILSGLVLPGLGQVSLKRHKRGIVFIIAALLSIAVIVVKVTQKALVILDKIKAEGGVIDIDKISKTASQSISSSDSLMINAAFFILIVCWIVAIIDAYISGKKKDAEELLTSRLSNSK